MIEFLLSLFLVVTSGASARVSIVPAVEIRQSVEFTQVVSTDNIVTLDGDVLTGLSLPPYGTLCEDTGVRGNPREWAEPLYILPAGTVVRLLEQPEIEPRDWVMIETAKWIPLRVLCK